MDLLVNVLQNDRADVEMVEYALETILNLVESGSGDPSDLGLQFSEIFLKRPENVVLVLNCLEEFEFKVRMSAVRVLTNLLQNKLSAVQQVILESPMGISRLMDILADRREVIRNDGLLLLVYLTKDNTQIQKIVAFENAFERLMDIIEMEGYSDGGIIVKDCLIIIHTMLSGNNSNQALFREASLIQRLVPFMDIDLNAGNEQWKAEKVENVVFTLKVIRLLVNPTNPQQAVMASQRSMQQNGLLKQLFKITFSSGVPTGVLQECINTVAEVIRGNPANQEMFDQLKTPSNPPRSAPLAILMSMISEKQPLALRAAAVYCFQSYLLKNEELQSKIIGTLLPSSDEVQDISAGQVLCTGLFGNDPFGHWCTSVAVSSCFSGNLQQELLRVQLSMKDRGQVTLLQQVCAILLGTQLKQTSQVGFLMLLICWLHSCPIAVSQLLNIEGIIPYFTSLVEEVKHTEGERIIRGLSAMVLGVCLVYHDGSNTQYTKDTLKQIIMHRVGEDPFKECLSSVASSEAFTRASRNPQVMPGPDELLYFDYNFVKTFKLVQDAILKALDPSQPESSPQNTPPVTSASVEEHDSIVTSYKDLIRDLDSELMVMRGKQKEMEEELSTKSSLLLQQMSEIQILKEQLGNLGKSPQDDSSPSSSVVAELQQKILSLHAQFEGQRKELQSKDAHIVQLSAEADMLRNSSQGLSHSNDVMVKSLQESLENLKAENEALLTEKYELDTALEAMQLKAKQQVTSENHSEGRVAELERDLNKVTKLYQELQSKSEVIEKEQEDLLVLLADNDNKVKKYKNLLLQHNLEVPTSDEEDEDETGDETGSGTGDENGEEF
jgi:hypothetical protein